VEEKAVIDLGTNTFHLLIFRPLGEQSIEPIFKQRIFVKLAEEGIEQIGGKAQERALAAMRKFATILSDRGVQEVRAIGTAALRKANNSSLLVQQIKEQTGIAVSVISGMQEAQHIADGVRSVWSHSEESALIMDIGGGSVEFIMSEPEKLSWMVSLPIGVAILHRDFHHRDPLHAEEEAALRTFLRKELVAVEEELKEHSVTRLIGASGTFDVIADLFSLPEENYVEAKPERIADTLESIVHMSVAERRAHPAIPASRVDMITVAVILIQEVLALARFEEVGISKYALKEGFALNF